MMQRIAAVTVIRGNGACQAFVDGMVNEELRRQQEKMETFRQCERKARELLARMEVLSQMGRPGRLTDENRQALENCGAVIRDQRPLDSMMERDVVTNYHVRQVLRLRRELMDALEKTEE